MKFLTLIGIIALVWVVGLFAFADRVRNLTPAPEPARADAIVALTPGSNKLFNCCVDLGFEAEDTSGNAQEIAAWARSKHYDSLIVVTSDYHMPRALLEIRGMAPEVKLTPYAVSTPSLDNSRWWRAAVTARRMTLEYMKYLAVLGREGLHRLTGKHEGRTPAAAAAGAKAS